jgi:hypothetical protein
VVLSGGISLGGYFAGCVAQLGHFVARWNATAAEGDGPFIYIDVISGASAGAMTGAMLFRFVGTGCADPVGFVRANFDAWCGEELSFATLLDPKNTGDLSFLSNRVIERAAERFLPSQGEVALAHGQDRLIYTCTLTSLRPIPFGISLREPRLGRAAVDLEPKLLGQTRRDWITFRVTPSGLAEDRYRATGGLASHIEETGGNLFMDLARGARPEADTPWDRLRWAALASGAFPVAWMPVEMPRRLDLYPPAMPRPETAAGWLTYSDGGAIDNVPLGRAAKVLQENAKSDPGDAEGLFANRSYVLIEQGAITAGDAPAPADAEARARRLREGNIGAQLATIVEAMREQSLYMDLRAASHINKRLRLRAETVWPLLGDLVRAIPVGDLDAYQSRVNDGLRTILESLGDARRLEQVLEQYQAREDVRAETACRASDLEPERLELFAAMAASADLLADLGDKHELDLLRITPGRRLFGAFLGNFGGFVKRAYMVRDFQQGLSDAREALLRLTGPRPLGEPVDGLFFDPARLEDEIPPGDRWLQQPASLNDVDPPERKRFWGLLSARLWPFLALSLADAPTRRRYLRGELRSQRSLLEGIGLSARALRAARLAISGTALVFGACGIGFWVALRGAGMNAVPALLVSCGLLLALAYVVLEIVLHFVGARLGLRPSKS